MPVCECTFTHILIYHSSAFAALDMLPYARIYESGDIDHPCVCVCVCKYIHSHKTMSAVCICLGEPQEEPLVHTRRKNLWYTPARLYACIHVQTRLLHIHTHTRLHFASAFVAPEKGPSGGCLCPLLCPQLRPLLYMYVYMYIFCTNPSMYVCMCMHA